jgi:hypothetical protein
MDGTRFDQLARTLVVGSRRKALKGLVGGVRGGLLARPGSAAVAPECRGAARTANSRSLRCVSCTGS